MVVRPTVSEGGALSLSSGVIVTSTLSSVYAVSSSVVSTYVVRLSRTDGEDGADE
jgi:hypothetical protein